jgi:hypothetical protein
MGMIVGLGAADLRADGPPLDLTRAVVLSPPGLAGPEAKAVRMLIEEVQARSLAHWTQAATWPDDGSAVILVGPAVGVRRLLSDRGQAFAEGPGEGAREGYRIGVAGGPAAPLVWVSGNDSRGVLFGVGRLLRALRIERRRITLPADFRVDSAPRTALRGHQLGYRPKTNSYDGWNVAMWEQYIRDLAVFGTNAIELIPPRSDDEPDSPHFPRSQLEMMVAMSRLADDYGLDVWIWYPAMDPDYADPRTVEAALKEWGEIFRALPRIDAVFVPGGDPGHTRPKVLFDLLEKQTANLRKYHPSAKMWLSPQSFDQTGLEEFLVLLKPEPEWLAGVVHGPQVRISLAALRASVPSRYPIRDYPDITHSRHCQYPVPDWDVAYALTEGREVNNPRPEQMARIFQVSRPYTVGFLTYSEGCHDDVNKFVWSALGWDERTGVRDVLREYARYFIASEFEESFADGLLGLERNWVGPVAENAGIDATLERFRAMERAASPRVKQNWRFQQALYRAYYDGYVRARLRHETELASAARAKLREARSIGSIKALNEAEAILNRIKAEPVAVDLRARLFELAEALFQSIHAQLSVAKYRALAIERGANLDGVDTPLTDANWLRGQIAAIRGLGDESARLARLDAIAHRTDPGPGGFYDDLGDPRNQPHLVRGPGFADDPAYYASSLVGFGFRGTGPSPTLPGPWWTHAESLYDAPLKMRYTGLDPSANYRVRVVYARERRSEKIRLAADDRFEIHGPLDRPFDPLEFAIPAEATADGTLTLTWSKDPGAGGTGRGCQVAEVWLLKDAAESRKP